MATDRRKFLQRVGIGALAASFPASIEKALAIPAHHRTGTIDDVEHIVILMQENRSFDHYFGTLRGVRGFGDPRAGQAALGRPGVEPAGRQRARAAVPSRRARPRAAFLEDLPTTGTTTHAAWNGGKYDQWVPSKGTTTMAYLTRNDIPFHYALADAFTVCDAYHCSLLGPTDPNRYHMWTGWVGNDGQGGGPVLDNAEAGYDWSTYPERCRSAGISWKIYQDAGAGLDAAHFWGWGEDAYIGNYGDNSLLYFHQYQNAPPGSPLFEGALHRHQHLAAAARCSTCFGRTSSPTSCRRCRGSSRPRRTPSTRTGRANYGAWYISQMLDVLTANPEVWSKTAFFLMYDENDGFFDHMVPPTPPQSRAEGISTVDTTNEVFPGNADFARRSLRPRRARADDRHLALEQGRLGQLGGLRSHLAHPVHRAALRRTELRPHRTEHHAVAPRGRRRPRRRRSTSGHPTTRVVPLPEHGGLRPARQRSGTPTTCPRPAALSLRKQEPGVRPRARRALRAATSTGRSTSRMAPSASTSRTPGRRPRCSRCARATRQHGPVDVHGRPQRRASPTAGRSRRTASRRTTCRSTGRTASSARFKGSLAGTRQGQPRRAQHLRACERTGIILDVQNRGKPTAKVRIFDSVHEGDASRSFCTAATPSCPAWSLEASFGWYDFTIEVDSDPTFQQRLAGHVETGHDSVSDPALGG